MPKRDNNLEALRDAMVIRGKITEILRNLLRQSQRKIEQLDESLGNAPAEQRSEILEQIREERVKAVIVDKEIDNLFAVGARLTGALRTANTIYPDVKQPYGLEEIKERRIWMDRALGACNVIQDELQYIAEAVYADKNKFTPLCLDVDALFLKIKSLRQADNRFLREA